MFCFYDGKIAAVHFGNFKAYFLNNGIGRFGKAVGNNNVEN